MVNPTEVLPDALGLRWGMPKEDCLRVLSGPVLSESPGQAVVRLSAPGGPRDIALIFGGGGGLERIEVELHVSRSFWEGDYTNEEMERIHDEYRDRHDAVVSEYQSVLGDACFHGTCGSEGYPVGQCVEHLAYWCVPGARIQVELDHWDKEFPFVVRVLSYPVEGDGTG